MHHGVLTPMFDDAEINILMKLYITDDEGEGDAMMRNSDSVCTGMLRYHSHPLGLGTLGAGLGRHRTIAIGTCRGSSNYCMIL